MKKIRLQKSDGKVKVEERKKVLQLQCDMSCHYPHVLTLKSLSEKKTSNSK